MRTVVIRLSDGEVKLEKHECMYLGSRIKTSRLLEVNLAWVGSFSSTDDVVLVAVLSSDSRRVRQLLWLSGRQFVT